MKTARKYLRLGKLPSESRAPHTWRTRQDPFAEVWNEEQRILENDARIQAKTLFAWLQRRYPGRFSDGQLRTLQRRLKGWRATEGPAKEIYFTQIHEPGELGRILRTWMIWALPSAESCSGTCYIIVSVR